MGPVGTVCEEPRIMSAVSHALRPSYKSLQVLCDKRSSQISPTSPSPAAVCAQNTLEPHLRPGSQVVPLFYPGQEQLFKCYPIPLSRHTVFHNRLS